MLPSNEPLKTTEENISVETTEDIEFADVDTELVNAGAELAKCAESPLAAGAPTSETSGAETRIEALIQEKSPEITSDKVTLNEYAYCQDVQIMREATGFAAYCVRKRGRAHILNGTVCQDFCAAERIDEDTLVLTVADGHGGSDYVKSDVGARLACQTFIELVRAVRRKSYLSEHDGESLSDALKAPEFKDNFIKTWQESVLRDYAHDDSAPENLSQNAVIRRYGTTFLFVVITRDSYIFGQLGDGAILLFNRQGQGQLFKRHSPKLDSSTSSLSSGRAKYAFLIDAYERTAFPAILLSTDGIYDKLDTGTSFQEYANQLLRQAEAHQELPCPFAFGKYDISAISMDDCTVIFALSGQKDRAFSPFPEGIFTQPVHFERFCAPIEIYRSAWNQVEAELHVVDASWYGGAFAQDVALHHGQILSPEAVVQLPENRLAFLYGARPELRRMSELLEYDEHLEKRYPWNDKKLTEEEEERISDYFCSNAFWLKVYESVLSLKKELAEKHLYVLPSFFEQLFVSEGGELYVCMGALFSATPDVADADSLQGTQAAIFQQWFGRFSIMGKLSCGDVSIPLFRCPQSGRKSRGQKICRLNPPDNQEPLCCVAFNEGKSIYALWNISGRPWRVESDGNRIIAPNAVLRLERDARFSLESAATPVSAGDEEPDAEFSRTPREECYQVTLFDTETADLEKEEARLEEG